MSLDVESSSKYCLEGRPPVSSDSSRLFEVKVVWLVSLERCHSFPAHLFESRVADNTSLSPSRITCLGFRIVVSQNVGLNRLIHVFAAVFSPYRLENASTGSVTLVELDREWLTNDPDESFLTSANLLLFSFSVSTAGSSAALRKL